MKCRTCKWQWAWARGECHACLAYRRRHGQRRPEHLIEEHAERWVEGRVPRPRKKDVA